MWDFQFYHFAQVNQAWFEPFYNTADNRCSTLYFGHSRLCRVFLSVPACRTFQHLDSDKTPAAFSDSLPVLVWTMSAATGSTSVQMEPATERGYPGVGRCMCFFWFALAHDVLGVIIIMVGVFGGFFIHDLFIYAGAIVIFLSLIWWLLWYTGNIDVPPKELEDDVGLMKLKDRGLSRLVRNMSERLSRRIRESFRRRGHTAGETSTGHNNPANANAEAMLSTLTSSAKDLVSSVWSEPAQHRLEKIPQRPRPCLSPSNCSPLFFTHW